MKIFLSCWKVSKHLVIMLSLYSFFSCSPNNKKEKKITINKIDASVESFSIGETFYVRALAIEDNNLWVGTSGGVLQIDRRSGSKTAFYSRKDGLKSEYILSIGIDANNVKWFGTNAGGLTKYSGNRWQTYMPIHGLADFWVHSITFEDKNTMWIGTLAGVNKFNGKNFTTYSVKDGLINDLIYGVAIDKNNAKWFATEGGVSRFDGENWKSWTNADGLGLPEKDTIFANENIKQLFKDKHNMKFVDKLGGETYMKNYVFCVFVDSENNKWFGTWGGGASMFDNVKFTNYSSKDGLSGNIVYGITQDKKGALWFGTDKGVSKFYNGKWKSLFKEDKLIGNSVYSIVAGDNNEIWIGQKGGVVKISEKYM